MTAPDAVHQTERGLDLGFGWRAVLGAAYAVLHLTG